MSDQESNFPSVKARAIKKLERDMGAPLLVALHHPKTIELMLNPDGRLWLERLGEPITCIGDMHPSIGESIIKTIAGYHGKVVTTTTPSVEGEFPICGSRFAGQLSPIVLAPTFAIRKRAVAIFTLAQYVEQGIMTPEQYAFLQTAVANRSNIVICGGVGSGKTTLANAIIKQMVIRNPIERYVIIEDTGELQCDGECVIQYHSTSDTSMTALVKMVLRMRPDRIIIGEVRGPEALDLLDAWNTGVEGGVATLHSNTALSALTRLRSLISRSQAAPLEIEPLIGEAVQVVVHIASIAGGRRVQEILEISGYADGHYLTTTH